MKSSLLPDIIGFWGYIPKSVVEKYPNATWVDLDVNYGYPETKIIPQSSCKIIRNILDNALYLKERIIKIIAPIGKDKCDSAFFISKILQDMGFMVVTCEFLNREAGVTPICESNLPLRKKVELITANFVEDDKNEYVKSKPTFGFWGVPPNDLSLLELFPDNTHIFGWLRCAEAGSPDNIELECYVPEGLPTIFYTQTFCAKNQLAKYLADKHNGLYIDVDGMMNNSVRAKIEAFLLLR